jgi:histidinol phosphatase-like enzyme
MLYLFDLDDTLIRGYLTEPRQPYDVVTVLPRRVERLQELLARGDTVRIISNQGGVAFGFITEAQMWDKLGRALVALGLQPVQFAEAWGANLIYVCWHDARGKPPYNDPLQAQRRKPNPDMLWEAMKANADAAALGVLMVGDRQEDEAAARNARVGFEWSHVFFGDVER